MTRDQIESRIETIQRLLNAASHPQDIKSLSRTLERLILLDADDETAATNDASQFAKETVR